MRQMARNKQTKSAKPVFDKERLRERYRPERVRMLFVGEAPPASGRFFYNADSGLYRAIREAFISVLPSLREENFLQSFSDLGCYLVDLCGRPVDRLSQKSRRKFCEAGEPRLAQTLQDLRPEIIVTLVRSIATNVRRAKTAANWSGLHVELPYPGRWHQHRAEFLRVLKPLLRRTFSSRKRDRPLSKS